LYSSNLFFVFGLKEVENCCCCRPWQSQVSECPKLRFLFSPKTQFLAVSKRLKFTFWKLRKLLSRNGRNLRFWIFQKRDFKCFWFCVFKCLLGILRFCFLTVFDFGFFQIWGSRLLVINACCFWVWLLVLGDCCRSNIWRSGYCVFLSVVAS
jgi:hypothetical protein